jgi:surface antigen
MRWRLLVGLISIVLCYAPDSGHAGGSYVSGSSHVTGPSSVSGPSYVTGPSSVSGQSYVTGTSSVSGPSYISGPSSVSGQSYVTGPSSESGPSYVTGPSSVSGPSYVTGPSSVSGQSYVTGPSSVTGPSYVTGASSVSGPSTVSGPSGLTGRSSVTGPSSYTGGSSYTGASELPGRPTFSPIFAGGNTTTGSGAQSRTAAGVQPPPPAPGRLQFTPISSSPAASTNNVPFVRLSDVPYTGDPPPAAQASTESIVGSPGQLTPSVFPRQGSSGIANTTPAVTPTQIQPANNGTGVSTIQQPHGQTLVSLSPYNPSPAYMAQMAAKVSSVTPPSGASAGLGWTAAAIANYQALNKEPVGLGYCTDYAEKIYNEVTGKSVSFSGPAATWYSQAAELGLQTLPADAIGRIPPGAIAVWTGTTASTSAGHVAIVSSNTGQNMQLSETNWAAYNSSSNAYDKEYEITPNFNKVSTTTLTDTEMMTHANPISGNPNNYQLLGFILP